MGRPRKTRLNLPKGVYYRHGSFYRVVQGKWIRLGNRIQDVGIVEELHCDIEAEERAEMERLISLRWGTARQGAKVRGLDFSLTKGEAIELLRSSGWRCAVTGTRFSMELVKGRKPYAPSIDRTDSDLGYTLGNCRIVCVIVNIAMNTWGDEALRTIAKNMHVRQEVLDVQLDSGSNSLKTLR